MVAGKAGLKIGRGLTIGALAKTAGLSRSTLLYYDRLGLLSPGNRNRAGYRLYSPSDAERLERICLHRQMGIALKEIAKLLDDAEGPAAVAILKRRLQGLGREIAGLRRQQRYIVNMLKQKPLYEEAEMVSKERWVEIMRAAGLSDSDMHNWHIQFEKMEPEGHQDFLQSLGIQPEEIKKIRQWARGGQTK
jgi:DNA-binding transcriptional MerR regulator